MSTEKMLPCPFCAGKPEIIKQLFNPLGYLYGINCSECGNCFYDCREDTQDKAVERWNTRAPVSGLREKVEALKDGYVIGLLQARAERYSAEIIQHQQGLVDACTVVLSLLPSEPDEVHPEDVCKVLDVLSKPYVLAEVEREIQEQIDSEQKTERAMGLQRALSIIQKARQDK